MNAFNPIAGSSRNGIFYLQPAQGRFALHMTSSLIWVLIGVYIGFFIFLNKVMKDA